MKARRNELFVLMFVMALFPAASFADNRAGGEGTTANITLSTVVDEATDIWQILEQESLTTTTTSRCIVVACSDVDNPSGFTVDNVYNFVISINDTSPGLNTSSERSLEMTDDPDQNDPVSSPVCSTRFLSAVSAGTHDIYWLGAKASAADTNTTVLDTSMTIGCFNGSEL